MSLFLAVYSTINGIGGQRFCAALSVIYLYKFLTSMIFAINLEVRIALATVFATAALLLVVAPLPSHAMTINESLSNLSRAELVALVTALRSEQSGNYSSPVATAEEEPADEPVVVPSNVIAFEPGAKVRTTDNLKVRSGSGLRAGESGVQPQGAVGTLLQGPVNKDGYVWWRIDYETGVDGWSVENWLRTTEAAPAGYIAPGTGSGGSRTRTDDDGGSNNDTYSPSGGSSSGSTSGGSSSGGGISRDDAVSGTGTFR